MTRGFLVIDKPGGVTSNEVVTSVRRASGVKKVGHAGTLDPMATGVLVVGVGKVTRLIRFIQDQPKEYLATASFGVATDTLDADGAILSRVEMDVGIEDLQELVPRFTGHILQVPPMVSALKHQGRRLYELARSGEMVEREARQVTVHELDFISVGPGPYPEVELRVVCGKGTYVRSLVDDIAGSLGGVAHLTALRRTRVGSLNVDEAIHLSDLDEWNLHLLEPSEALRDLPRVVVPDETAAGVRVGMRFVAGELFAQGGVGPYRVTDGRGELLAIYRQTGEWATPEVVLSA
jgi:tRNA pseudouridine55 synthase